MCLGIPGQITEISGEGALTRMGTVSFGGVSKEVSLAFVPDAGVGDYVIIHAGFAISKIDEQDAQETLKLLRELVDLAGAPGAGANSVPSTPEAELRA